MRRTAVTLAIATLGAVAAGTASADAATYRTTSSFGFFAGNPDAFLGELSSRNAACERRRIVRVFRKRSGRRAAVVVGADRTSATGQWAIERANVPRARYYAVVSQKRIRRGGRRHVCRSYRSSTLPFGG